MSRKSIELFLTDEDLADIVNAIYNLQANTFVVAGLLDQASPIVLREPVLHPFTTYLVGKCDVQFVARPVEQRGGETKYSFDQLRNPNTVMIRSGGMLDDDRLVAAQIGTASNTIDAAEIFALLSSVAREKCEKVRSYYVGPFAAKFLDSGGRLVPTARSPKEYDLTRQ